MHKGKIILSALLAIGFLLFSYWITNLRIPLSGEETVLTNFELVRGYFQLKENTMSDSVLMVNICYDKQEVIATDEYGFPTGKTYITDRNKLLTFLQYLKEKDDYKYIILDVFFGEGATTEVDSLLFTTIHSMPRIVIPCHSDEKLIDEKLYDKAGIADYTTTYQESSFIKFPYLPDSLKSLPMKMYEELTGKSIDRKGIFYTEGNKLVRSSIVLTFDFICNGAYNNEGEKTWYNLGMDLLGDSIDENTKGDSLLFKVPELTTGKYIVVGAYENEDIHEIYLGEQPGVCINFNAYLALLQKHHHICTSLYFVLFFTFFIFSYLILSRESLADIINKPKSIKNPLLLRLQHVLLFLCSWIGFSLFLTILCIITYLWLGEVYDIFITASLFGILNTIVKLITKYKDRLCIVTEK